MSILKTGFIAASLCLAASFAHAGTRAPMQGQMSWNKSWAANLGGMSAFASAQPRMARTWAKTWTQFQGDAVQPRGDGKQDRPLSSLTAKDRRWETLPVFSRPFEPVRRLLVLRCTDPEMRRCLALF